MSERPTDQWFSKPRSLLEKVKGISIVDYERPDECCGFGGTFAGHRGGRVSGRSEQRQAPTGLGANGVRCVVSGDMSCLMHLQGCAHRNHEDLHFLHLAQVLNGATK